jgi:drug/metabolite transporter (DMT)-like permease
VVLGRERVTRRRLVALALTSAGLVLVLAGAAAGSFDVLGAAMALGAAVVYTTYILVSERTAGRVSPYLLSALVCTGASITLTLGASLLGELRPQNVTAEGWLWLACIAVVSTVAAIGFFFAGLRRVGPTSASILATVEPVVTVFLAFLVFGETLAVVQVAGAALVLTSVVVLQSRRRARLTVPA